MAKICGLIQYKNKINAAEKLLGLAYDQNSNIQKRIFYTNLCFPIFQTNRSKRIMQNTTEADIKKGKNYGI